MKQPGQGQVSRAPPKYKIKLGVPSYQSPANELAQHGSTASYLPNFEAETTALPNNGTQSVSVCNCKAQPGALSNCKTCLQPHLKIESSQWHYPVKDFTPRLCPTRSNLRVQLVPCPIKESHQLHKPTKEHSQ